MSKKKEPRIAESKLLKAITELEGVAKGDALEDADPEGGLSTEGEPLSGAAPSGRGESTKKSRAAASSSSSGASSGSSDSGDGDGDDDDDDEDGGGDDASAASAMSPIPPPKKDKKGKVSKAAKSGSRSRSSSSSAGDDSSSGAEKSFREAAEDDEVMSKGLLVNDFLEAMVDQISLALHDVQRSVAKALKNHEAALAAHVDEVVAKSTASQHAFNVRLAKAVAAIGTTVQEDLAGLGDAVKSIANQPVSAPRGKAVLSKGEVNQPPWGGPSASDQRLAGGSDADYVEQLREVPVTRVTDWLYGKIARNQLDQNVIIAFEADRYDPAMLPPAVRKALVDDLIK